MADHPGYPSKPTPPRIPPAEPKRTPPAPKPTQVPKFGNPHGPQRSILMSEKQRPGPIAISEEEYETMAAAREREYEITTLLDRELGLAEPEVGNDLHTAACADLRGRGINPEDASQEQMHAAYKRAGAL